MKQFIGIFLTIAATLSSCSKGTEYTIDGALHGGANFEGETIYLVPFANATEEKIDSATIHDSRFQFKGNITEPEIYILRMRPMMKLFINELIFVLEPGHIKTILSKQSEVKGTALNDSIQKWNEWTLNTKSIMEETNKRLKQARNKHNEEEVAKFQGQMDSLRQIVNNYNHATIQRNNNVFGEFLERYAK